MNPLNGKGLLDSARPKQWIKNFFIFAPLIFSQNLFEWTLLIKSATAFAAFSLLSSSLYMLNDIRDLEEDRHHPIKSQRPLVSGNITKKQAWTAFIVLLVLSLAVSFLFLNQNFVFAALIYVILQFSYSFGLKHVIILDVFIVASGFIIRVIAGGFAINVQISHWLLICTLLLSLFLALSKRRHEIVLLGQDAVNHRPILQEYSPYLLDQMIAVVTASTVIAYSLYTISEETVSKFGSTELIYTLPFVLYGIFRYLYLIHQRAQGGTPEALIIKDKPLLLDVFLWIASAVLILYFRS
ncbi:MAG: decaprenyl-phosphate phosphoribosyltransferase [Candidatus Aminicenantes bacterium]|nr:decaprenyl-phosphate phosphoribosyltransferase [Candidatus Aminicenantes bacterium]